MENFYEYLKGVTPIQLASVVIELQQLEGKIIDDNTSARSFHLGGFHKLAVAALTKAKADEDMKKTVAANGNIEQQIKDATKAGSLASAAKRPGRIRK